MRATYFIDLDGTIVKHGTNTLLPGARALLDEIIRLDGKVVFTTRRGDSEFKGHPIYSAESAETLVKSLKIPDFELILDSHSPRVVINDDQAAAYIHPCNGAWEQDAIWAVTNR